MKEIRDAEILSEMYGRERGKSIAEIRKRVRRKVKNDESLFFLLFFSLPERFA